MNIKNYLKKNVFASVGKIITVSSVTILLLPLIIKQIGLDLYGIISLTLLFSGVTSLIDLGLSQAIVLLNGDEKISNNQVITSALYINLSIILLLSVVFIVLMLLDVNLLGKEINITDLEKTILLITGFLILIFMLLNNFCKSILEANYLIHVVNISLALYTPALYLIIYALSFFTKNTAIYIVTPLILTFVLFVFYIFYIKKKTTIKLTKINKNHIKYVLNCSFKFLNLGILNSIVTPVLRYVFVLMVANVSLYAILDLSFKVAMLANSFIVSISTPMFAVFSKEKKNLKMIKVTFNVFWVSVLIYIGILIGFYFFGAFILSFLNLETDNLELLYNITFILIISLGSVATVEVFYRYFLGNNQLKKAFFVKLNVPITSVIFFLFFTKMELIYRFIYAYGLSLIICSIIILITFLVGNQKLKQLKV
ncbi:hypothetical protein [uncultured Polaribacter sp.]|uniref:hypothetical protein n=1 Tax=uncultured Polaribacter sp. TaxID=174711 RepID=UPI0026121EA6|nr:hypothetical protein [uncultured Polaribacter sp.]